MRRTTVWILGIVMGFAALGIGMSLYTLNTEGVDGFWKRKRSFVESHLPMAKPALDETEKAATAVGLEPKR
jgi:hypothetical protein